MKYDELDFFEFFESEPFYLFEKEAGFCSYSYEKDNFRIHVSLSCYEDYMSIGISYKSGTVYSGEIRNIEEVKKFDTDILKVVTDKNWIFLKKWPCIGIDFDERLE